MIQRVPIGSLPECLACSCLQSEGQELGGFLKYKVDFIEQQRQRSSYLLNRTIQYCTFFPFHILLLVCRVTLPKGQFGNSETSSRWGFPHNLKLSWFW